jgi:hypothetical protein
MVFFGCETKSFVNYHACFWPAGKPFFEKNWANLQKHWKAAATPPAPCLAARLPATSCTAGRMVMADIIPTTIVTVW